MSNSNITSTITAMFQKLPPGRQREVLRHLSHAIIPDKYAGRFVSADQPDARDAIAFELDGLMNAQSFGFMVELIPFLYDHLEPLIGQGWIETLDVGCRTGAGSSLLADLYMAFYSRAPLAVDTIDIDPMFEAYQRARWWNLRQVLVGDIFDLPANSYDVVICSHTIEHIPDPVPFARRLQEISRRFVALYCPYDEQECPPGHHTISDSLVESLGPIDKRVFNSWWYRKEAGCREPCVMFVLPPL